MQETAAKPLSMASLRVAGDDQSIAGHSAIVLARKAGMHVRCDADVPAAARSDGLASIDDPDFIFDTSAPALARLTQPQASRAQQAAFGARLAANRHCALLAGLVCGLQ
jgi:hypothetical protein